MTEIAKNLEPPNKTLPKITPLYHLFAIVTYLALSIILTWPLVLNFSTAVPGVVEIDADQNIWNLWWFKTALFDRHTNPFYTDLLYYPYWSKGLTLIFHTFQPLNGLIALPVTAFGSPIMGFNFIALFSFTATAFTTYLLAFYFLKNWQAALIAGALFSFAPISLGHFNVSDMSNLSREWMPLYLLFLHRWTGDPQSATLARKPDYRFLYLAGFMLLLNVLTNWYFTFYMLIYTALWGLWQLIKHRREGLWKIVLGRFALLGLVSGIFLSPVGWLIFRALQVNQNFILNKGIEVEIAWSAAPWSVFIPGRYTGVGADGQWGFYFFGYVALFLATLAFFYKTPTRWWWTVVVVYLVSALGPYLRFSDSSRNSDHTPIPLPYLLLREIPLVSISRIVFRFSFVADLAVALLAGYRFLNLKQWLAGLRVGFLRNYKGVYLEIGLLVLLLCTWILEVQTIPVALYQPQSDTFFTQYLKERPGNGALLEVPIPKTHEYASHRMFNQIYSGRPILQGYLSRPLKEYYREGASPFHLVLSPSEFTAPPLNSADFVAESQQLTLKELLGYYNFDYLVLYKLDFAPAQRAGVLEAYQTKMGQASFESEQIKAYKVPPIAPLVAPRLYSGENWYATERRADSVPFRWANNGDGFVGILAPESGNGVLTFQSWSFDADREIVLMVNGVEKKRLRLTTAPTTYQLELNWSGGVNSLEIKTTSVGSSPGKGDARVLSFALSNLTLSTVTG